jgi:hypothetical protein
MMKTIMLTQEDIRKSTVTGKNMHHLMKKADGNIVPEADQFIEV